MVARGYILVFFSEHLPFFSAVPPAGQNLGKGSMVNMYFHMMDDTDIHSSNES